MLQPDRHCLWSLFICLQKLFWIINAVWGLMIYRNLSLSGECRDRSVCNICSLKYVDCYWGAAEISGVEEKYVETVYSWDFEITTLDSVSKEKCIMHRRIWSLCQVDFNIIFCTVKYKEQTRLWAIFRVVFNKRQLWNSTYKKQHSFWNELPSFGAISLLLWPSCIFA